MRPALAWVALHVAAVAATTLLVVALAPRAGAGLAAAAGHLTLLAGTAALEGAWLARAGMRTGPGAGLPDDARVRLRSGRWLAWTLAGMAPGGVLGIATLITADGLGYERAGSLLGMLVFGTGMAAPQARLLRAASGPARWWVPASAAGWLAGGALWHAIWESPARRELAASLLPLYSSALLPGGNEVSLLATTLLCSALATSPLVARALAADTKDAPGEPPLAPDPVKASR